MPSRTRTTGEMTPQLRTSRNVTFAGVVTDTTSYPSDLITGEVKTTTDVVTPGFRQRIERGEIINNPFYSDTLKRTHSYSNSHHRSTASGPPTANKDAYGLPGYGFPLESAIDPTVHDVRSLVRLASTKAQAAVMQPSLQGLVEVAEFHKTMELFRVRTGFLNRHLTNLLQYGRRKGKLRKGFNFLAENWLKYRYGIMPLVYSMEDVLSELGRVRSRRQTAYGYEEMSSSGTTYSSNDSGLYWKLDFTHNHQRTTSVRAGVLYEFSGGWNEFGLKLSDTPSAAWELIPFSFVADWAANVGDYIQAVTPKVDAHVLAKWHTIHAHYVQSTSLISTWKNVAGRIAIVPPSGGSVWDHTTKERVPSLDIGIAFRKNLFQHVSAKKRVLDAIALTGTLLQGRLPSRAVR